MSQATDNDNQFPSGQRGQRWIGGQCFLSGNQSEAHMETVRQNRVNR